MLFAVVQPLLILQWFSCWCTLNDADAYAGLRLLTTEIDGAVGSLRSGPNLSLNAVYRGIVIYKRQLRF
jgi:hypothetical protein